VSKATRGVVGLLTAQAFAFGVTLALLIIPANALFLDAYGAEWLPATYIAIAVVGTGASALIARAARRTRLVRVATATLGALALLYGLSWVILVASGVWVSAVLLVLFPIALQIGFVFIGGQAGRLLDVRQMKELFPRVVSGFAVGFFAGGLLAIPLLALLGSTEDLLLATTAAQLLFMVLLLVTERRFPEMRIASSDAAAPEVARPPLRMLFASGLALLLLVYQVLSAMGSQVVDFLLFDRASAQYTGDELTRFLSAYTAVLNLADILFLALLAGPLMRRFGLRLGLVLNPAVVAALLAVMTVVVAGAGAAAFGLFVLAGVLRIGDIATTDGTTRTSINAAYQVVPVEERLAVQAVVEGIGVPLAIGVTGVLLLALNLLDLGTGAVIVFGLALGVIWTVIAFGVYRSYTDTLAAEMQRRSLVPGGFDLTQEDDAARDLLHSDDARDVRLGLDLLAGVASPASAVELRHVADHADPELRVRALVQLAASGDERAAIEVRALVLDLASSADQADRRAAAWALGSSQAVVGQGPLVTLLDDADSTVRAAALDAVKAGDSDEPEVIRRVVAAVEEPRTAGSATAAVRRLGDPAVPLLAAALARNDAARRPPLVRAAANAATEHGLAVIAPALDDADRVVVLTALEALGAEGGRDVAPPELLDRVFDDAAAHAARALAARSSLGAQHGSLQRALEDEVDLARRLVIAVLALRHGERVRDAVRVVERADGQRRALGVEALDVLLSREEAAIALPLVRRDLTWDDRATSLQGVGSPARTQEEWIADMAADPEHVWRSHWLAICARHAAV
jgi:hypothetical protein